MIRGEYMNIEERVIKDLAHCLGMPKRDIRLDSTFSTLDMDSLDAIESLMMFEETFDIEITDEEAKNLISVGDVVSLVSSKFNGRVL